MFALIAASILTYATALVAVGIYVAIRSKGGSDYFISDRVKLVAVIAFALLSTIPTDVLTAMWLRAVRGHIDVTAGLNLFLFGIAPVVAVIVAVQALLLSRAYRARPVLHGALFLGVYVVAHACWMNTLFNPVQDILRSEAAALVVGLLVLAIVNRFVWSRPVAGAGAG